MDKDIDYLSMLDISSYTGSTAADLENKWVTVNTAQTDIGMNHRTNQQSMQLADGKTLLISGGYTVYTKPALKDQTIAFNAETLSWEAYPNYEEAPFGNRQIFRSSSVYVPGYGVGFYGGIETGYNDSWSYPPVSNLSGFQNPSIKRRNIGYTGLTFLDITNTLNPWSVYPIQNNKPYGFAYHQESIFDPKTNRIFYFGGTLNDGLDSTDPDISFASSITFDFAKGEWGNQLLNGQGPTPRFGHTATLFLPDYCHTLDLETYQWNQQNISAPVDVELVRSQHSVDKTMKATLSLLILNVTDPLNITLNEKYEKLAEIPESSQEIHGIKPDSQGKTIGIAVGVTVAGLIAIGCIIFWIIRKRKLSKKKEEYMMEVNWDEIEQKYTGNNLQPVGYSPHSDESNTLTNEILVPDVVSPILIAQKDSKLQRPDVIEKAESFSSTNRDQTIEKPDGSLLFYS
ncbi:hypothetical protein INT47_011169 [Mucor saturninus]|uniref:Kelch repeat protein n=1 Tax=Mucor saturninus TaxID=64648 RepID=A0A8H7VA89_9FUNG|nr:hypothetical protein INT47_011169 [Mucor saturninus]